MNNALTETISPLTSNSQTLWGECLNALRDNLDRHIFSAYIEPLKTLDDGQSDPYSENLTLEAPSNFHCQLIERNYSERIQNTLRRITGNSSATIELRPPSPRSALDAHHHAPETSNSRVVIRKRVSENFDDGLIADVAAEPAQPNNINPKYTFDSFVVGNSNEFCNAAALRVAENPGMSYNPLFIYGGVGLGKTHLLHSIGNAVLQRSPAAKILYISSEAFTNELILALRHARMDEFKLRLRNLEILLIDDIQFISGKERTQEEFFHTFNHLYGVKCQIVMTSDKIPSEIEGIEDRLQTRLAWGLTADIQAPDFETRVAILKRKAHLENFFLPEDVALLIAERISSNVRELEGALTRLHAISSLKKLPLNLDTAQSALRPLLEPKKVTVNIEDIKRAVAQHFSIKVCDITSKKRTRNLSFPRHVAMYLCRKHTTSSYPEIGQKFGGRDHSSVIHAANVVSNKIADEPEIKELVIEIERRIFN